MTPHNVTYSCCPDDIYPNIGQSLQILPFRPIVHFGHSIIGRFSESIGLRLIDHETFKDYNLYLTRKSKFYSQNLLVPCVLISMLAPFTFLLPADSGEKISLGVTILLSLTVFQLIVAEQMPPSEDIPIIGEFYLYTMALVSTSILVTIGKVGQNADDFRCVFRCAIFALRSSRPSTSSRMAK